MKKIIYLFLTVLIVGCSGEDGSNNQDNNDGDNNNITCEYSLTTLDAVVMPLCCMSKKKSLMKVLAKMLYEITK